MNRKILLGLALASLIPFYPAMGAETGGLNEAEINFVTDMAQAGMTEVKLGQIASKNAKASEVKTFGRQMVVDHSKANGDLKEVARRKNVSVPAKLDTQHAAIVDKFSALKKENFDGPFIKQMVEDHNKVANELHNHVKTVTDPDLKKWIDDTLPTIEHHLKMARDLDDSVNKTK